jgi:hypothetical protein
MPTATLDWQDWDGPPEALTDPQIADFTRSIRSWLGEQAPDAPLAGRAHALLSALGVERARRHLASFEEALSFAPASRGRSDQPPPALARFARPSFRQILPQVGRGVGPPLESLDPLERTLAYELLAILLPQVGPWGAPGGQRRWPLDEPDRERLREKRRRALEKTAEGDGKIYVPQGDLSDDEVFEREQNRMGYQRSPDDDLSGWTPIPPPPPPPPSKVAGMGLSDKIAAAARHAHDKGYFLDAAIEEIEPLTDPANLALMAAIMAFLMALGPPGWLVILITFGPDFFAFCDVLSDLNVAETDEQLDAASRKLADLVVRLGIAGVMIAVSAGVGKLGKMFGGPPPQPPRPRLPGPRPVEQPIGGVKVDGKPARAWRFYPEGEPGPRPRGGRGYAPEPRRIGMDPDPRRIGMNPEPRRIGMDPEPRRIGMDPEPRRIGMDPEPRRLTYDPDAGPYPRGGTPIHLPPEGEMIGGVYMDPNLPPAPRGQQLEPQIIDIINRWLGTNFPAKSPNAPGPDLITPPGEERLAGASIGDIKPLNEGGIRKFSEQVDRWRRRGFRGGGVRRVPKGGGALLFGYDQWGNVYFYGYFLF